MSGKTNLYELFLKVRLWLKIGLAQEKKGDYDSAKTSYLEAQKLSEWYFRIQEIPAQTQSTNQLEKVPPDSNFFSLKLFYQPYFCLVFLQEKNPAIAHANLKISEQFIEHLENLTLDYSKIENFPNLPLSLAECQMNQADLLFFKGFIPPNLSSGTTTTDEFYIDSSEKWYWASIKTLIIHYLSRDNDINDLQKLLSILFASQSELLSKHPSKLTGSATGRIYYLLAMNLSKLGNIHLSKITTENEQIRFKDLLNYFQIEEPFRDDTCFKSPLIKIISCYLYAARLFLRAGMHKECAFEYEKVIRTLRYFTIQKVENDDDIADMKQTINFLEEKVFHVGRKHYDIAYAHINRKILHQQLKNHLFIKPAEIESFRLQWLGLLDIFIKEIKDKKLDFVKKIQGKLDKQLNEISTEAYFDNVMYRIDCLNYKTIHLEKKFKAEIGISDSESENVLLKRNHEIEQLELYLKDKNIVLRLRQIVKDGLFCCINSIEMREIHSNTYWWLHLGRAFMHRFLAEWARRYNFILQHLSEEEKNEYENEINEYLGSKRMKYIDETYQLQNALENFHQVKQMHTGGKAYKSLIQRMYYLNDDFNDRIYHFYLAQERFEIHRGRVKKNIKEVEELLRYEFQTQGNDS